MTMKHVEKKAIECLRNKNWAPLERSLPILLCRYYAILYATPILLYCYYVMYTYVINVAITCNGIP